MRPTVRTEVIAPEPAEALANLLGSEIPIRLLPALWHWVYLLDRRPQRDLGLDGHAFSGIPAPPGPGRRRMFAGGAVTTHQPLRIGVAATRTSSVVNIRDKQGRTGPLTFVRVRSEYTQDGRLAIAEDSDIVYREPQSTSEPPASGPVASPAAPPREPWLRLTVDETVLFRFSALTYNAHRIHYDRDWARHEGYPDLVVHGPLQALLMGELIRRAGPGLLGSTYVYRLVSPMVGPQALTVCAAEAGIAAGAEVRDVRGTVTARSVVESG
jgi:3-methylfumaryl-CoA hydratase